MSSSPVWKFTSDALSEKILQSAERSLGVRFPADYRACVRENHGGASVPAEFTMTLADGRKFQGRVGLLLTLDTREEENVIRTARDLKAEGRLPDGLIPIIDDGGGNFVCLDVRIDPPTIAHLSIGGEVLPIAETFGEFLAKLF